MLKSNFLLFEIKGATYFLGKIKKEQIYIRDKIISTNGGIRVTISSKSACNKFLRSVKDFIKKLTLHQIKQRRTPFQMNMTK